MARALVFDPFAGISGDMILGALVDLGLPAAWLGDYVASLGFPGVGVVVERVSRRGIACGGVRFELPHEHVHRHLKDVLEITEGSSAPARVKAQAAAVFRRLAEAEAQVHGVGVEKVHFHEVGALDAILDVLCTVAAIQELGFEHCFTRGVALGTGWIEMEHGRYPVPAPAALKLLEGLAVLETNLPGECTTPTGAALLATLTGGQAPPAEFVMLKSGFGAGTRDTEDRPNCLRLIACEIPDKPADQIFLLQADVDDLPPEYVPAAQEALLDAGALDTVSTTLAMKKGRPGLRLEALVQESRLEAVIAALFAATSTIGARYWPVKRSVLAREEEVVTWRGQRVRRKRVRLPGGGQRAKPEYEDILRAAEALGMAPYEARLAFDADAQVNTAPAGLPESSQSLNEEVHG
ncbi:MAG: nickel pincer cofactor biosynthesis protein LarC [Gemmatimonadetes bacterium]|nr:nickel pincer cofactor biosynthesis protein LarC [Gemmatimonadota bacterium]